MDTYNFIKAARFVVCKNLGVDVEKKIYNGCQ